MVKQKQPSKMKTSEIIDELYDFIEEKRGDKLDEEFRTRYPFNYLFDRIDELEKKIELLESNFDKHSHLKGQLVKFI